MKTTTTILVFACLILSTACSKTQNNSLANFQPEVSNSPDNFQLQATNVKQVSSTIEYNWTNSGTQASVDKSSVVGAGTARVIIIDKNNTIVYSSELQVSGSATTTTGVAGLWKIRLELSNYDGTLNFRVQKK